MHRSEPVSTIVPQCLPTDQAGSGPMVDTARPGARHSHSHNLTEPPERRPAVIAGAEEADRAESRQEQHQRRESIGTGRDQTERVEETRARS